jgi:CBS domain-containing protein
MAPINVLCYQEELVMKVSSILTTKSASVITIGPDQSVAEAVALYIRYNIGALVVVDSQNSVIGIISERDVIRHLPEYEHMLAVPVAAIMTREVIVGLPQDDLGSVAHTMTERRFRHLPIVEGGKLVGIISIGDVLKAQRDQYRGQTDTLETQILADQA